LFRGRENEYRYVGDNLPARSRWPRHQMELVTGSARIETSAGQTLSP